jgi:hypothetical protein
MKDRKYWWVANDFEGSNIVHEEERPQSEDGWSGPYATFGEAQRDAIAYHRASINTARNAIYNLVKLKRREIVKGALS